MPLEGQTNSILMSKRVSQIDEALNNGKPTEAMSLAIKFHEDIGNDDTLVVCLKTALLAMSQHGVNLLTDDLYEKSQDLLKNRFFNPEMMSLGVSSKILVGKPLDSEDIKSLERAFRMDPRTTKKIMDVACGITSGTNKNLIIRALCPNKT